MICRESHLSAKFGHARTRDFSARHSASDYAHPILHHPTAPAIRKADE